MNILFVCTEGRCRSKTAAAIFNGLQGIKARHAGIHPRAEVEISPYLIEWADEIFCMERRHETHIRGVFPGYSDIHLQTLEIPDDYAYMSPDLVVLLLNHPTMRLLLEDAQASMAKLEGHTDEPKVKRGWWPFRRSVTNG